MSAWAEGGVKSDLKVVITVRSAGGAQSHFKSISFRVTPVGA